MLGAALFAVGVLLGRRRARVAGATGRACARCGRSIQTCCCWAACSSAAGLLGELIAGQRAELAELRREVDEARVERATRRDPR
jgi:hypothetical protein